MGSAFTGLEAPVEFTFDNDGSPSWTVVDIRSTDSFGFLYAISNALAMRGINVYRAKIRSTGGRVSDQFLITNRWGRKIEDSREQNRLRTGVLMIKEFTRFLPEAPNPSTALRHFDQFLDKLLETSDDSFPDEAIEFLASTRGMNMLAQLLAQATSSGKISCGFTSRNFFPLSNNSKNGSFSPGRSSKRCFEVS
jgi:glutamate-ammonia-ligase adenylyltransferase